MADVVQDGGADGRSGRQDDHRRAAGIPPKGPSHRSPGDASPPVSRPVPGIVPITKTIAIAARIYGVSRTLTIGLDAQGCARQVALSGRDLVEWDNTLAELCQLMTALLLLGVPVEELAKEMRGGAGADICAAILRDVRDHGDIVTS